MNDKSPQDPFTTSTLATDEGPATGQAQNASPPNQNPASAALLATVVPAALVCGGIISCGVLWFISGPNPIIRIAGAVVLLSDIVVAIFLRFYFLKRAA